MVRDTIQTHVINIINKVIFISIHQYKGLFLYTMQKSFVSFFFFRKAFNKCKYKEHAWRKENPFFFFSINNNTLLYIHICIGMHGMLQNILFKYALFSIEMYDNDIIYTQSFIYFLKDYLPKGIKLKIRPYTRNISQYISIIIFIKVEITIPI